MRLDNSVRLITFQFSFSKLKCVPPSVKTMEPETEEEWFTRKDLRPMKGEVVIPPIQNISLLESLDDFREDGYELVGAFHKPRNNLSGQMHQMVRYTFARKEKANPREEFLARRDIVLADLTEICRTVMWRVRAYLNPFFYSEGDEAKNERVFHICLEVRTPLFRPDGTPVTEWQRDENDEKVGDASLPLMPDYRLRVIDGVVGFLSWGA